MIRRMTRRSLVALVPIPFALFIFPALGDVAPAFSGAPRLAIGGYDTVAYFTEGKPMPGRLEYQTIWHDARWQFSSKENLDLFTKNPEQYAAQYDGHCALGVSWENAHDSPHFPSAQVLRRFVPIPYQIGEL
jgi:hypothetical protein